MKPWLKDGIIGAIAYAVANVALMLAAACGFTSGSAGCEMLTWMYFHMFPTEMIEESLNLPSGLAWVLALLVGCGIGFAIGVAVGKLARGFWRSLGG